MARESTFSNEQLCEIWSDVYKNGGTRADVVKRINEMAGIKDSKLSRKRTYGNVIQRVRNLSNTDREHRLTFPDLTASPRGCKATKATMVSLQAILTGAAEKAKKAKKAPAKPAE